MPTETSRGNMIRDRKTGRMRKKDVKRSRAAIRAGRKRKGKPMKAATKLKIAKRAKITRRTGRTIHGRRARR